MKVTEITDIRSDGRIDLQDLRSVDLTDNHVDLLGKARGTMVGPEHWVERRCRELRDVFAMTQLARKDTLHVMGLSAVEELIVHLFMKVPVPCMAKPGAPLTVLDHAFLELRYPQEILTQPMPGTAFVRVMMPRRVWLANADYDYGVLCLGKTVPRNLPCRELIVAAFDALRVRTAMWDERDEAGIINYDAARWWQINDGVTVHRPLTHDTLFDEEALDGAGGQPDDDADDAPVTMTTANETINPNDGGDA